MQMLMRSKASTSSALYSERMIMVMVMDVIMFILDEVQEKHRIVD